MGRSGSEFLTARAVESWKEGSASQVRLVVLCADLVC